MKSKWIKMYLDFALRAAEESHGIRLKVGAVFVSPEGVMSMGINGLAVDGENECEYKEWFSGGGWVDADEVKKGWPYEGIYEDGNGNEIQGRYRLVTKNEVSHAEENCYSKMLRQGVSANGGTLFLTHAPCINCSRQILNSGTKAVYYLNDYKSLDGVQFLIHNGVQVIKVD